MKINSIKEKGAVFMNVQTPKQVLYILTGVYVLWLIYMIANNIWLITSPYPIEYREGHSMSSTYLLLKGIMPFTVETYPEYYNSYGILFNLLALPFAAIWQDSLIPYRLLNELCVLLAIGIALFYKKRPTYSSMLFAALCNFYLFYHINSNVSVRPDGLGVLLFISSIIIPLRNEFSNRSLTISGVLGVLAFFTKPYYLLGWYLISAILLFRDWKRFLYANIAFHLSFLAICMLVNWIFPLYFYETIFAYSNSVGDMHYSLRQMIYSLKRLSPLAVLFFVGFFSHVTDKNHIGWQYLMLLLLVSVLLLYPLGTNDGAYLTYHAQLLAPIMLAFCAEIYDEPKLNSLFVHILVLLCCVYSFVKVPLMHRTSNNGWEKIEKYISESSNINNNPCVAPLIIFQDKSVTDDGVSGFVYEYMPKPLTTALFGKDSILLQRKNQYVESINRNFVDKKYDCVFVGRRLEEDATVPKSITDNYHCVDSCVVNMPCNLIIRMSIYKPL